MIVSMRRRVAYDKTTERPDKSGYYPLWVLIRRPPSYEPGALPLS